MKYNFVKRDGLILKIIEALLVIIMVNIGYFLAFYLRYNLQPQFRNIGPFYEIIPYISLATIVIFIFSKMSISIRQSMMDIVFKLSIFLLLVNTTTAAITFFNRGFPFPRGVFVLAYIIQIVLISISNYFILLRMKMAYGSKTIMILGSRQETTSIAKKLLLNKYNLDKLKYICNDVNSNMYELIDDVDKIFIGSSINSQLKIDIISYCISKDKVVYLVPEIFEIAMINARNVQLDDLPVFEIDNLHLSMENRVIKRSVDLLVSFVILLFALPIMVLVALAIKLYDRGPVFFKQERLTQGNRKFKVYKFRTMVESAEKKTGPILAAEKDPRITPLGRFLRASRLDELPQLFNILKGDMSLVGPRPEREHFIEQYAKDIPHFKYRVVVKAGLTGLAQIFGKYTTSPEDKVRFDLLYIRDYSLLMDLKIIIKTIKVIFTKESSRGVKEEKSLEELFFDLGIRISEELSVTRVDD